ncbi:hypothetical protein EVAR_36353_1 [Eumeta japonica]|uniref:Uncharacterized protein n=1 Tax=Eumeta variegata TaxID=151549 RepID=A0A4C1W888_EUMVA|nr:hypothetical protein EVAR_36353_1 [Eumeta japonica]
MNARAEDLAPRIEAADLDVFLMARHAVSLTAVFVSELAFSSVLSRYFITAMIMSDASARHVRRCGELNKRGIAGGGGGGGARPRTVSGMRRPALRCGPTSRPADCCARGRPIIVEWERDARHSAGLSLVRIVRLLFYLLRFVRNTLNNSRLLLALRNDTVLVMRTPIREEINPKGGEKQAVTRRLIYGATLSERRSPPAACDLSHLTRRLLILKFA